MTRTGAANALVNAPDLTLPTIAPLKDVTLP